MSTTGQAVTSELTADTNGIFNPNRLLDAIIERMQLKNDAALARLLSLAPTVISKIRHARLPIGASLLIRMEEETDISIRELRELMGDKRKKFRLRDVQGKTVAAGEKTG